MMMPTTSFSRRNIAWALAVVALPGVTIASLPGAVANDNQRPPPPTGGALRKQEPANDSASSLNGLPPSALGGALVARLMLAFDLADYQAAGIVGNLAAETGGFTKFQEERPLAGRGGYGLAQWTGPRRRAYEAYAAHRQKRVSDLDVQLDFLKIEIAAPGIWTGRGLVGFHQTRTTGEAALYFSRYFERPHPNYAHENERVKYARQILASYRSFHSK